MLTAQSSNRTFKKYSFLFTIMICLLFSGAFSCGEAEGILDSSNSAVEEESSIVNEGNGTEEESDNIDEGLNEVLYDVVIETNLGIIVIKLNQEEAPASVKNFLNYMESGFYDGSDGLGATIIHRVVNNFVIQGGGLTEALIEKETMDPVVNESSNFLSNVRGSVGVARAVGPDSGTSQFFINLVDNLFLDGPLGYTIFGNVVDGMDIVDMIAEVETEPVLIHNNVPVEPIVILSVAFQE